MVTLYQAEWCPFSSAVRELLNELGIPFVAKPVEPWPEDRDELRSVSGGHDEIPTLRSDDGTVYRGTEAIFEYLREQKGWQHAADHRQRYVDHREARHADATEQLLRYF
jgi:glutathione S-transferase